MKTSKPKLPGGMAWHAFQTHCKRGHELSGPNIRIRADRNERICKACDLERVRAYQRRKHT